jgi:hypothetical protein
MRRHNYKLWKMAIFCMLAVISLMGFGYAAMQQQLTVQTASVQQTKLDWSIGFSGTNTVTPLSTAASSISCGTPTISTTSATLGASHLSAPGDGCRYALQVANTGDIAGKISAVSTVVSSNSSGYTCTQVSSGQVLSCTKSGDSSEILVFPSANASITATTLGSSTASTIASTYVAPLINSNLAGGDTTYVYLYVFLRETPANTSFSGLRFTTTVNYTQN